MRLQDVNPNDALLGVDLPLVAVEVAAGSNFLPRLGQGFSVVSFSIPAVNGQIYDRLVSYPRLAFLVKRTTDRYSLGVGWMLR